MTTFNERFNKLVKATLSENDQTNNSNENKQVMNESAKSQDFFQDNNTSTIGKRYTATTIKSINLLSNIAYARINKKDHYNKNVIFDIYLLETKNLNSFLLDRKLAEKNKHEMIYMLGKECMPARFHKHTYKEENFL